MTDRAEYNRQWYADNIEHLREYWKEYREKHREERNAYLREWRKKRKETEMTDRTEYLKQWRAENKTHRAEYQREFRLKVKTEDCTCGCGKPRRPGSKYAADSCSRNVWEQRHPEKAAAHRRLSHKQRERLKKERQDELFYAKKSCNCHQYSKCLVCRNAERRRAFRMNETPVYLRPALAAAIAGTD
jgi:hypothetical protein